jgi:cytochrome P450
LTIAYDPVADAEAVPYEDLARLRAQAPVWRSPSGLWVVTRAEDVEACFKDVTSYTDSFREPGVVVPDEEQFVNEIPEPRHGRMRRVINSAVAPHRIGDVEKFVRDFCRGLLGPLLEAGRAELVHDFVVPVPTAVIAHLVGVPEEDYPLWAKWSDDVVQGSYPTKYRNERGEGLAGAHPEFTSYVDAVIARRRADPDPPQDFLTRLLSTEVDGVRLTDVECRTQLIFLLIAGNETTRNLIANILLVLATKPGILKALQADRSLVAVAVEESLRHDPPVQLVLRHCVSPTEVAAIPIPEGDRVVLSVASANRDRAPTDDPDTFRLDRSDPRDHIAFGDGAHVCPGASLARLEARVAIEAFLDRVAEVELDEGWSYRKVPVFWAQGPAALPVRLVPRR